MKLKNIIPLIGVLLITSICSGCEKTGAIGNSSNHSWKIDSESKDLFVKNIGGFFNKKSGITVGYAGEIHYTKDGGKTWNTSQNSSLCLFGLSFVNSNVAFACGNGGAVLKTTDGGANWKGISGFGESEPNHPRYLSFVDENTGWIATANKFDTNGKKIMLGFTKDGARTWDTIVLPEEINEIAAIYLRTPYSGYIVDNKNNLYITNDGCKSFTKQPLNIKDADLNAKSEQHVVLKFSDENNAFIAYMDKDYKYKAARSNDGGKTWVNETIPDLENGVLYLSQDGKFITFTIVDGPTKVLEYK